MVDNVPAYWYSNTHMTTWSGTLRSLFLGPWWWFPSAFFAPWWFSVFFLGLFGVSVAYAIGMGDSELFLVLPVYVTSGWVGWWGRRLHGWENAVLVPDLPRHLFVVCLAMVTGVALVFAAFSMYMGDPSPPLGQAVLLGVGVVYGSVCLSGVMAALVVSSPCLLVDRFVGWGAAVVARGGASRGAGAGICIEPDPCRAPETRPGVARD